MSGRIDPFGAKAKLDLSSGAVTYFRLAALEEKGLVALDQLPFSIRILLEGALRRLDGLIITEEHVRTIANWGPDTAGKSEIPFSPARVLMQDFTGVPAVVDLAALREAVAVAGGDPKKINPRVPVDLVIDHSIQVDQYGTPDAAAFNEQREFERNRERYTFLKWGAGAFENFTVVPPSTGIVHQVNLEYLAKVVQVRDVDGETTAYPDSLVGTDSHTTMINGLGVLGWGVGGIEAEAAMLGQPIFMLMPEVVGFRLEGQLPKGATATDLVLTVTELLRSAKVVDKFVEFHGPGLDHLTLADRATLANMAPEYGATMGFFPVDEVTLRYLEATGRDASLIADVRTYLTAQKLFRTEKTATPTFSQSLTLDMGTVVPCLAGPKRPQDRIPLTGTKTSFQGVLASYGVGDDDGNGGGVATTRPRLQVGVSVEGKSSTLTDGAVVIAAITSCTNTSNPSVMIGAGLLAKKAVERGLTVPSYVKTSLAPGSRVVTRYLENAGLMPYLEKLGFDLVGYGCTTCIGNSGPLPEAVSTAVKDEDMVVVSVLSGNRNFEGRVNPQTRANYLASPPLVVAYAIAGTMEIDLGTEPLGLGTDGQPVYLADVWPTAAEVNATMESSLKAALYQEEYGKVTTGNPAWNAVPVAGGDLYAWEADSTYIRLPSFFEAVRADAQPKIQPISGARVLAVLGDSVTTDHISPAGSFPADGAAGRYLIACGVDPKDFNSFGARRGNHEVMMRGTFANIRIRNRLVPGTEGGFTRHLPGAEIMSIYDAAIKYAAEKTPLMVIAGKEYGTGSSRDWAAKGAFLLGVKAVIAESFERIHRSNLVYMGVLPLQFKAGETAASLGLTGEEVFSLEGLTDDLMAGTDLGVVATRPDGTAVRFSVACRIDTPAEIIYYRNGGILHTVLREML